MPQKFPSSKSYREFHAYVIFLSKWWPHPSCAAVVFYFAKSGKGIIFWCLGGLPSRGMYSKGYKFYRFRQILGAASHYRAKLN